MSNEINNLKDKELDSLISQIEEVLNKVFTNIDNGANVYKKGLVEKFILAYIKLKTIELSLFEQDSDYITSEIDNLFTDLTTGEKDITHISSVIYKCASFITSLRKH